MRKPLAFVVAALSAVTFVVGCSSAPKNDTAAHNTVEDSRVALRKFEAKDPGLQNVLNTSAGYCVFPSVGKGAFIVGGAYGKGALFQNGQVAGFADIKQASVGFQAGGEDFAELIIFRDAEALSKFKQGSYALSAEATAVALKAGAAANADFKQGVAVFTMTNSGLEAGVAVAGQKFGFTPDTDVQGRRAD